MKLGRNLSRDVTRGMLFSSYAIREFYPSPRVSHYYHRDHREEERRANEERTHEQWKEQ